MSLNSGRKNRIDLSNYNHHADIEHRLMMSQFTEFELEILQEVLHGSLRFSVESLAHSLDRSLSDITKTLQNLERTKLLQIKHDQVIVHKERRKYYESQIEKFDDDFEPDVEFALSMLRRVPIHILPLWYSIPKATDDIFESILEKYLATPEAYRRYIMDLSFEDPVAGGIMQEVFAAPDFKVCGKAICEKYKLSREQFEETLLRLEFQLVCFLSYSRIDGEWKEVVTPLHEWRQFLRFQRDAHPATIADAEVERYRSEDFGFILDLAALLRASKQGGLPIEGGSLDLATVKSWLPLVADEKAVEDPDYRRAIVSRALQVHMGEIVDGQLVALATADHWLKQTPSEQAVILYRCVDRAAERDLRSVEKSLKRIVGAGWITFDDFMKGFIQPIDKTPPVALIKKGKRWRYEIPTYNERETAFVHAAIFQHLFQAGFIVRGIWNGQDCFKVTSFGKFTLGE